jgi:hypothetical protein
VASPAVEVVVLDADGLGVFFLAAVGDVELHAAATRATAATPSASADARGRRPRRGEGPPRRSGPRPAAAPVCTGSPLACGSRAAVRRPAGLLLAHAMK